jgi:hypothetical protein
VTLLLRDRCKSGIIEENADGEQYKMHPVFSDSDEFSHMIKLFYDGLGGFK